MEVAIQLKKSIADISILCIIIGKISYRQQLSPVILFVVDKSPEISFNSDVLRFCLAILFEGRRQ